MVYNQLIVIPTPETMEYLSSVMAGSPLDLDLRMFKVEVMLTQDEMEPEPDRIYQAKATSLKIWYDSFIGASSLILSMVSPDLERRCVELHEQGVLREFYNYYNPHMKIVPYMPALSHHYKTFVNAVANALCSNERPLEFTSEFVTQISLIAPPDFEYNQAMLSERQNRRI